jgi:hypothetical protein
MSFIEDYNMKIEAIKAITDEQITPLKKMPLGIFIAESEYLYYWCQDDKEELTTKGIDWTIVEDLPIRCGALREAESRWTLEKYKRKKAANIWARELSKGYALRNDIYHHFKFAFRKNQELKLKVKKIAEISTNAGMIQGLNDFSVLGRENRELLKKIGFDFTLLDLAAKKCDELSTKKADASWYSKDYIDAKKIRDQAVTHLQKAVDYIREFGKFVFRRNVGRLKGYRSDHLRNVRLKSTRKKNELEPVTGFEMVPIDS